MMLDATQNFPTPLTTERLFAWQAGLLPTGRSNFKPVITGAWRDDASGPMQVVSTEAGRERIYFEAPPASCIETEMEKFLSWINQPQEIDGVIHAAIAHLWFVTIHPFEDGNGRIARALADMSLARFENSSKRFCSLAAQIRTQRQEYYGSLESTQKGDLDITPRLLWFTDCLSKTIDAAEKTCAGVLRKADFWRRNALAVLNERQKLVLNRLFGRLRGKTHGSQVVSDCQVFYAYGATRHQGVG